MAAGLYRCMSKRSCSTWTQPVSSRTIPAPMLLHRMQGRKRRSRGRPGRVTTLHRARRMRRLQLGVRCLALTRGSSSAGSSSSSSSSSSTGPGGTHHLRSRPGLGRLTAPMARQAPLTVPSWSMARLPPQAACWSWRGQWWATAGRSIPQTLPLCSRRLCRALAHPSRRTRSSWPVCARSCWVSQGGPPAVPAAAAWSGEQAPLLCRRKSAATHLKRSMAESAAQPLRPRQQRSQSRTCTSWIDAAHSLACNQQGLRSSLAGGQLRHLQRQPLPTCGICSLTLCPYVCACVIDTCVWTILHAWPRVAICTHACVHQRCYTLQDALAVHTS
mmetsp:Transcript_31468/g.93850  ORF Transcript_31468/g.93850 Transcript_31468/m.93850 type:complete len:330 (-) Transcript_31468:76-1065(-)